MSSLREFFAFWVSISNKYENIKKDEEKKDKSVSLGVQSITQSVICGAFVILCLLGIYACINHLIGIEAGGEYEFPIITILGIVLLSVIAIGLFLKGLLGSLFYMIYQFKLNKRAVRWVALVIWVLMIVAVIGFAILFFAKI